MQTFRFSNLTNQAMKCLFSSLGKTDHCALSCLIVVVLGHGSGRGIYDKHCKLLPLENICSYFSDENCSSLKGKPKIFLFESEINVALNSTIQEQNTTFPSFKDSFIILSTLSMAGLGQVSYVSQKIADIMAQGKYINFVDVISEARNSVTLGVLIDHNEFPTKPLYFPSTVHVPLSDHPHGCG